MMMMMIMLYEPCHAMHNGSVEDAEKSGALAQFARKNSEKKQPYLPQFNLTYRVCSIYIYVCVCV